MAEDRIEIAIELDDGSIRRGFLRVEEEARRSSGVVSQFFQRAGEFATGQAIYDGFKKAFSVVTDSLSKAVTEAIASEDAVNKLNTSLRLAGTFSEGASQRFQDLASEMQRTTIYSDEQVLSIATLARNYTKTNEEAIKLTKATIDFASATGTDAESAVRKLGGTLSGELGAGLTKLNPELKNFTKSQLEAGAAIDSFSNKFLGAAQANSETFSGSVAKLGNSFSDLFEEIGKIVTQSPEVRKLITSLSALFTDIAKSISDARPQIQAFLGDLIVTLVGFSAAVSQYVLVPLEVTFNAINVSFNGLTLILQGGLVAIANAASKVVSYISPDSEIAKNLNLLTESTKSVFDDMSKSASTSVDNIFNLDQSDKITNFLNSLNTNLQKSSAQIKETATGPIKDAVDELTLSTLSFGQVIEEVFGKKANLELIKFANSLDETLAKTGVRAVQAFGGAVASGMSAVGRALVNGGDLFKAFGGAVLGALGQALITEGSARIIQGIARLADSYGADPTGYTLIGVGSSMAALGGAMAALGSGGGNAPTATNPSSASGPSFGTPPTGTIENPADAVAVEKQRIVVNIQGDVLDSRETGLRIVDLINEAFDSQGANVLARA